ncbi:TPA: anaerobic ribonucleoside-triphosphate reductase activating protein [archaeon]|uniref:Anaerobic ribonucleoside-triphosphate reductase activating protein n=1 Tax=Candidatus Naiadarchaeum limnaeum TaxID=2756139 RepID=A0A832XIF6_9ARCH|nr:anaerobic ribonucleoside-triphosphate reductase activating protein [Candidatus Naiadarchaeum limnaeum]
MLIKGLYRLSLIDFPNKIACILFLSGCNFRCPYCYNKALVLNEDIKGYSQEEIFDFLKSRIGLLDGVVISGGEPTLNRELPEFISRIKDLGFLVKLDTNGSNPEMLKQLTEKKLVNYIAMDLKAPLENYQSVCKTNIDIAKIKESLKIIADSGIEHELRATVLPALHTTEDIIEMAKTACSFGIKKFYLQQFSPKKSLLDADFEDAKPFSQQELEGIRTECLRYVDTEIRGKEK